MSIRNRLHSISLPCQTWRKKWQKEIAKKAKKAEEHKCKQEEKSPQAPDEDQQTTVSD